MRMRVFVAVFASLLLSGLALGAPGASAYREPMLHAGTPEGREEWIKEGELAQLPLQPTEHQMEGACGLAISSGTLYISDYHHRAVHSFTLGGTYSGSRFLPGGDPPSTVNQLNAVCGLAADGGGNLYANEFHQDVIRLVPSEQLVDAGEATGVAVGADGDLYVNHRTSVAVYDAPVEAGEAPAQVIGSGTLDDAYGLAIDSKAGRVYVPDAADETIKVFEPAIDLVVPVDTIDGPAGAGFNSLFNAALAVDSSATDGQGHLLVVDNLKPLFEKPQAAVYEFGPNGEYLDTLQARKVGPTGSAKFDGPIFGDPSGISVDPGSGDLYVTTGNSELSNVVKYGPFQKEAPPALSPAGGSPAIGAGAKPGPSASPSPLASTSVVVQRRGVRVSFDGKLTPHSLPRHGMAPVGIVVDAKIGATGGDEPPQLRRISIEINRNGRFTSTGLPVCRLDQIQPSTTAGALAACRRSLVGEGSFSANVKLPQQSPFPSAGKVLAFNGRVRGKPAILAHIYGTQPAPTSTVLPFVLGGSRGTYGTVLEASLPQATGEWGYVTGLRMSLRRRFSSHGKARSYLSAGCPAPAGFPSAAFPLARTSFDFSDDLTLISVLNRTCRAKG